MCSFLNFRGLIRRYQKQKQSGLPINLSFEPNLSSVDATLSSSHALILCFHTPHVYSWPSLAEVIQPSRCQTRGVLSFSLSSGCDSRSALIPLPSIPSSVSRPDRGLREYHCRIIIRPRPYESMEHAANITPCNTLPRQHPHICP